MPPLPTAGTCPSLPSNLLASPLVGSGRQQKKEDACEESRGGGDGGYEYNSGSVVRPASNGGWSARAARAVGRRVLLLWEADGAWYGGRLGGYDPATGRHTVVYDDGDKECIDLRTVRVLFEDSGDGDGAGGGGREHLEAGVAEGRRVLVFWPSCTAWFSGRVGGYDAQRGMHAVAYDDGDDERVDFRLRSRKVVLEDEAEAWTRAVLGGGAGLDVAPNSQGLEASVRAVNVAQLLADGRGSGAAKNWAAADDNQGSCLDCKAQAVPLHAHSQRAVTMYQGGAATTHSTLAVPAPLGSERASERRRKRRWGSEVMGLRVRVFEARSWRAGLVTGCDMGSGRHTIAYDDGGEGRVDLSSKRVAWADDEVEWGASEQPREAPEAEMPSESEKVSVSQAPNRRLRQALDVAAVKRNKADGCSDEKAGQGSVAAVPPGQAKAGISCCPGPVQASSAKNRMEAREFIGRRVFVFFDGPGRHYGGQVESYNATSKKHFVAFDDGDERYVNLWTKRVKLEEAMEEGSACMSSAGSWAVGSAQQDQVLLPGSVVQRALASGRKQRQPREGESVIVRSPGTVKNNRSQIKQLKPPLATDVAVACRNTPLPVRPSVPLFSRLELGTGGAGDAPGSQNNALSAVAGEGAAGTKHDAGRKSCPKERPSRRSSFLGVHCTPARTAWYAQISVDGRGRYLGAFLDEVDAALAYDIEARKSGKPTNFPDRELSEEELQSRRWTMSKMRTRQPHQLQLTKLRTAISPFRGVSYHSGPRSWYDAGPRGKPWTAVYHTRSEGRIVSVPLGHFAEERQAALAWDHEAHRRGRQEDCLNFPYEHVTTAQIMAWRGGRRAALGECPVCFEELVEGVVSTPCGHRFCRGCIEAHLLRDPLCPECRREFAADSLRPVPQTARLLVHHRAKAVEQLSVTTGEVLAEYPTAGLAAKALGHKSASGIVNCCIGLAPRSRGFAWRYVGSRNLVPTRALPVEQLCARSGRLLGWFPCAADAAAALGAADSSLCTEILTRCRNPQRGGTPGGYAWRFEEMDPDSGADGGPADKSEGEGGDGMGAQAPLCCRDGRAFEAWHLKMQQLWRSLSARRGCSSLTAAVGFKLVDSGKSAEGRAAPAGVKRQRHNGPAAGGVERRARSNPPSVVRAAENASESGAPTAQPTSPEIACSSTSGSKVKSPGSKVKPPGSKGQTGSSTSGSKVKPTGRFARPHGSRAARRARGASAQNVAAHVSGLGGRAGALRRRGPRVPVDGDRLYAMDCPQPGCGKKCDDAFALLAHLVERHGYIVPSASPTEAVEDSVGVRGAAGSERPIEAAEAAVEAEAAAAAGSWRGQIGSSGYRGVHWQADISISSSLLQPTFDKYMHSQL
jgi:hypothetical protein